MNEQLWEVGQTRGDGGRRAKSCSNLIVQKYGGTSVGSIELIQKIARRIVEKKKQGNNLVVVVSAMGDTTNELMQMAKKIDPRPSSRDVDILLSTGEQISIALLAMAIQALGEKAISLTGPQCGIITDGIHRDARIKMVCRERLLEQLELGRIVIVAGFQGLSEADEITTLGRGGSDITAVAIAAELQAECCEIYTDVDGVYTTDPRIVPEAQLISRISYDEMLELAAQGARVLHPRSVEMAKNYQVSLYVKSSFHEGSFYKKSGTEIGEVNGVETVTVRGAALDTNIVKVMILDVPERSEMSLELLSDYVNSNINLDLISQNMNLNELYDIFFTTKGEDVEVVKKLSQDIASKLGTNKVLTEELAKVSIIGNGIGRSQTVMSHFSESLHELGIKFHMFSKSEIAISCIIDREDGDTALQHLHHKFGLDN